MKKLISILLLLTSLTLTLTACGARVRIENYEWTLKTAMHLENNQLVIDAVNEADSAHPDAKAVDITLVAKDGVITVTDKTNGKAYEGTYTEEGKTPAGTDYKVTIDGKTGHATVAMTTYADGSEEPTLPINLGYYSLYFYAK